jgi:hypothetical protein
MMKVRKLSEQEERVESGAVQFGEDWPGLFIRGDHCIAYAAALKDALEESWRYGWPTLQELRALLQALEAPLRMEKPK